ncbi:hypothetical protein [Streptantibioticus cattleyicolor]|uniref:Uncharacterized protein n=1 Tax=Streptantibioticus cattleyicolor (strain ATCC 35852 / DSM 46488 / JCM 4925 / NBRC 14057 / NRRL 8057) TaxID=1003195 RepID=F8JKX9_STREN|nr:hypothetical protein [Streptantibioticus cattleyicolor]AEW99663.1 hypothetical protein SCATT_p14700 [Streptantibioticus cattleyicolor NRRL 8057 = DSM 46488]CCB71298.1 exported protein of unknown function [Streptantibioticus cattleyicolor NRRL 8057 = DSM 46488]
MRLPYRVRATVRVTLTTVAALLSFVNGVLGEIGDDTPVSRDGTWTAQSSPMPPARLRVDATGPDIIWQHGQLFVTQSGFAGLDDVRIGFAPQVLQGARGGPASPGYANLGRWTGSAGPSRRDCAELITAHGVGQLTVHAGSVVCVALVGAGGLAAFHVTAVQGWRMVTEATVWSAAGTSVR